MLHYSCIAKTVVVDDMKLGGGGVGGGGVGVVLYVCLFWGQQFGQNDE